MEGTLHCSANYVPLSPLSFIDRAAAVFADRTSLVHGATKFTWKETHDRCLRLASALTDMGITRNDVVAVIAPNIPAMYELHFGVPMAGAVLCTLNTRHDSSMLSVLLRHSEAKVLFVDQNFLEIAQGAYRLLSESKAKIPVMVLISESGTSSTEILDFDYEYENILRTSNSNFEIKWPLNECDPISLNYTSGTTSSPKGVIYSHRGAYLNALAVILLNDMTTMPVYLWTVPMFHCNGWCLAWGMAAQGGSSICLRNVSAETIFDNIILHKVTHMAGAPTVLSMIVNARSTDHKPLPDKVVVMTGASPPPSQILLKMEDLGFRIIHIYGLTETHGPGTICTWKPEWDALPLEERSKLQSRQGLQHIGMDKVDIKDPITMKSVPADGKTMGEVMFQGNTVMNGYFKNLNATKEAFSGGWFRTGDLGVKQPDGYIQLKDRSKDIIISGGENISTIEVESILFSHPAVLDAAVVGRPDEYWGETPCAFVKLKEGVQSSAEEMITFCRARLPHYMAPKTIIFEDLPKTSTGKTQKFILKEKVKAMGSLTRNGGTKWTAGEMLSPYHIIKRNYVQRRELQGNHPRMYTGGESEGGCYRNLDRLAHIRPRLEISGPKQCQTLNAEKNLISRLEFAPRSSSVAFPLFDQIRTRSEVSSACRVICYAFQSTKPPSRSTFAGRSLINLCFKFGLSKV